MYVCVVRTDVHDDLRQLNVIGVPTGGDRGERSCGQVQYDPALLQRHLHQRLQEDDRRGLPGETDRVSGFQCTRWTERNSFRFIRPSVRCF